jgi:murein DD-endopeptidase MepM/ murein hydrolase activator NlpD
MRRTQRALRSLAPLLVLAVLAGSMHPAVAGPEDRLEQLQEKQADTQAELDDVAADESSALADVREYDAAVADAEGRVADLDRRLGRLDSRIASVKRDLTESQQKLAFLTTTLQGVLNRLVDQTDLLEARAIAMYKAGPTAYVEGLLEADSMQDLAARYQYQQAALESDSALIDQIEVLRDSTEERRDLVEEKQNDIARAKLELESNRTALAQIREERAFILAQKQAILDAKELQLNKIRSDKARLQATLRQYERSEDSIEALLSGTAGGPFPVGGGQLLWPAAGAVVSPFGMRIHPIFGYARMHSGIDIAAPYGAPVIASDSGTVVFVGVMSGYGNVIVVDHGGGLATTYNHLSGFLVSTGQSVGRGATIGAVGCTGWCTGPHLHFEVRVGGTPVDPMPYLA